MTGARAALLLGVALSIAAPGVGCSAGAAAVAGQGATLGRTETRLEVSADGRSIALRRGDEALLTFGPDAFELGVVDALDDSASYDPYAIALRGEEQAGVAYVAPSSFRVERVVDGVEVLVDLAYPGGVTARVAVSLAKEGTFSVDVLPADAPSGGDVALVRVRARTSGDPAEGFYGLGEWEDAVNHRGKVRPMQIEVDASIESGNDEAHVPVPLLLGTHGWGMFVASRRVGQFDVAAKDPSAVEATFAVARAPRAHSQWSDTEPELDPAGAGPEPLRVWLFAERAPLELLRRYAELAGSPRPPAPWALGPWIWRNESRDQEEVEADVSAIRALDLATSGIWIDRPYASAVNTFDFDPAKYTDPAALVAKVHAAGLRLALWSTPYLEEAAAALRGEATSRGFFPPGASLPLNPWSPPIDFTNADAATFWTGLVHRYTDMGIDGFKLDYGEDIAPSLSDRRNVWRFADGSDERTMHHDYSARYHDAYASALPDGERFLLCRAAHWGEQDRGLVIWPGDMDATFTRHGERFTPRGGGAEVTGVGGLPATVVMGLSLSASGFSYFGSDTGGYRHSPPDAELFARWVEQTALSSVMQVGDGSSQPPWVYTADNGRDDATLAIYRDYARLHLRLFPYEWTYAQRGQRDGRPIERPLGLAYPELGVHPDDVYMFGDDLFVAPVLARGERVKSATLPPGEWIDWWTAAPVARGADGRASLDAPLERLPLLVRAGAIVPMLRPTIDTLAPATDPSVDSFANDPGALFARVAPGPASRFDLWDGTTLATDASGAIALASGSVFTRGFVLELMAHPEPVDVVRDDGGAIAKVADRAALDAVAEGWAWEPANHGTLWVKTARAGRLRPR